MPAASIFVDSGAFSLYTQKGKKDPSFYSFKKGSEFRKYLDRYGRFMKSMDGRVLCANVDVIYNPDLTWKTQQFFEKEYGVCPVPIIHYRTPLHYLDRYIGRYDLVGVGGFAWGGPDTTHWLDNLFLHVCPGPKHLPIVKLHGFALTSWAAICRWPWWSVDSTSWSTTAAYGGIYVPFLLPEKVGGGWSYGRPPHILQISGRSVMVSDYGRHFNSFSQFEKKIIEQWLFYCGVTLADVRGDGCSPGRGNDGSYIPRFKVNLTYFKDLEDSRPPWPWPLDTDVIKPHHVAYGKGFGL